MVASLYRNMSYFGAILESLRLMTHYLSQAITFPLSIISKINRICSMVRNDEDVFYCHKMDEDFIVLRKPVTTQFSSFHKWVQFWIIYLWPLLGFLSLPFTQVYSEYSFHKCCI